MIEGLRLRANILSSVSDKSSHLKVFLFRRTVRGSGMLAASLSQTRTAQDGGRLSRPDFPSLRKQTVNGQCASCFPILVWMVSKDIAALLVSTCSYFRRMFCRCTRLTRPTLQSQASQVLGVESGDVNKIDIWKGMRFKTELKPVVWASTCSK